MPYKELLKELPRYYKTTIYKHSKKPKSSKETLENS